MCGNVRKRAVRRWKGGKVYDIVWSHNLSRNDIAEKKSLKRSDDTPGNNLSKEGGDEIVETTFQKQRSYHGESPFLLHTFRYRFPGRNMSVAKGGGGGGGM